MDTAASERMQDKQDRQVAEVINRERNRLWNFIRQRMPNREDAEDILQEVFFELFEAHRLMKPVEQTGAWMIRVARNRITDWFRKKKPVALAETVIASSDGESLSLADLLPSPDAGPEAAYARTVLIDELLDALEDLPPEQRQVFLAHEVEGRRFEDIAAEAGENINTLLSRKRYAVRHLRRRLQQTYDDLTKG